jgi:hypothetical protein
MLPLGMGPVEDDGGGLMRAIGWNERNPGGERRCFPLPFCFAVFLCGALCPCIERSVFFWLCSGPPATYPMHAIQICLSSGTAARVSYCR